jgi:hypothetical protein
MNGMNTTEVLGPISGNNGSISIDALGKAGGNTAFASSIDADGDKKLSKDELLEAGDADKSGKMDLQELIKLLMELLGLDPSKKGDVTDAVNNASGGKKPEEMNKDELSALIVGVMKSLLGPALGAGAAMGTAGGTNDK